ncbi:MAG: 50S ribosomal protein L21 [Planctomycetaceae bacterium]|nr:50S ribosomal protein L21 [Planctomycetaceae bacterium]
MYAIIEDSGQQFKVSEGDVVNVDVRELAEGAESVEFGRVLLVSKDDQVQVGTPLVKGATVQAEIVNEQAKGPKVFASYLRRRKASKRRVGHRQKYLQVRITKIVA